MRQYIFTEKERRIIKRFLEKDERLEGFNVLYRRCRMGLPEIQRDGELIELLLEWDIFVSYASEDKALALELREKWKKMELKVWMAEKELKAGDSTSVEIGRAMIRSKFRVPILSKNYLEKPWTIEELKAIFQLDLASGQKTILPIWHGIHESDLVAFPFLMDMNAERTDKKSVNDIAIGIGNLVKGWYKSKNIVPQIETQTTIERIPIMPKVHYGIYPLHSADGKSQFPKVGFFIRLNDPNPIRARIKARCIIKEGNKEDDRGSPDGSGYYEGKKDWHLNPGSIYYGNFTSVVDKDDLKPGQRLEIRVEVTLIDNDGKEFKYLPIGWIHVPEVVRDGKIIEKDYWFFEP